jgi:fimbrial chaperone protein
MSQLIKSRAVFLLLAIGSLTAEAGDFSVSPVRIFMTPRDRAVAVTVTNEGDQEVVMQADLYTWKQKPGGDEDLVLTEDMILSPPILKLAPKSRQVLRLARLTPAPAGSQVTYRMIVREIPEARTPSTDPQVLVALAFSLPVFITPPGAKPKLECDLARTAPNAVNAVCKNTGNAYAQPRGFVLNGVGGAKLASRDTGGYILPDITRTFELKQADGKIPGGKVALQVALDDGTTQVFETSLAD